MNDKQFHEMDQTLMNKIKPLRDKKISDGILKGFSMSVERRISAKEEVAPVRKSTFLNAAWVPAFAMVLIASFIVLRSPILPTSPVQYAQVAAASSEDVQDEIEVLKELGVWDEVEDGAAIGDEEVLDADLELTYNPQNSNRLV